MIPQLYIRLYAYWHRALTLSNTLFTGFWLGVFDRSTLRRIDKALYDTRKVYSSTDHNTRGFFPWEEEAITPWFTNRKRLAVIGAGGGREVFTLASRGHDVSGFECNPTLVQAAATLFHTRTFEAGRASVSWLERDEAPSTEHGLFDGIVVGWSVYSLMMGRETRVRFLQSLGPLLSADAPVMLSFFTRSSHDARYRGVYRVSSAIRRLLNRPLAELGDDLRPNYLHFFTKADLEAELERAGLEIVAFQPQGQGPQDSGYAVAIKRQSPLV